jgi:hypothetical protein
MAFDDLFSATSKRDFTSSDSVSATTGTVSGQTLPHVMRQLPASPGGADDELLLQPHSILNRAPAREMYAREASFAQVLIRRELGDSRHDETVGHEAIAMELCRVPAQTGDPGTDAHKQP